MKILVIGGSYFYGRVFVMEAAKEHTVTIVNRGTYSMESFGVTQITGDRKDAGLWKSIADDFDVLVDFCGYQAGDITNVLENLTGHIGHYIFISTVDVYQRGISGYKDEHTPLELRQFAGETGEYIGGKVALEQELQEQCQQRGIPFTVLRPAILYGPYNYAPRESVFIQLMAQQQLLPRITDADGRFQFIYVKDAAWAIIKCLGNEKAYGQSYNLCGDEIATYDMLADTLLTAVDELTEAKPPISIQEIPMTIESAVKQGLPLPFPLTEEETELYSNEKSKAELGISYVRLEEGMSRTCRAFWNVYSN
ncbi:MAG: NAD-dependent epimerase/dehydratase family protein [Lachnospiraceae bacterium]|nr:NAD-dependent epimerase/dehydratase family protein [Lachnospiraceae bacterium]MDE6625783.1 NAD-dependent epimerase/dehydratase family protein [Lachnospiraceae bacterium]